MKDPKRVATGRKSRRKGARNERAAAKILSSWWDCEFKRTPLSGGWADSNKARQDFGASGDLVCPDPSFPFLCEIKSQEGWELEHLLRHPETCLIMKWWAQANGETPPGKTPLLLFTRKLLPWFTAFREHKVAEYLVNHRHPVIGFMFFGDIIYVVELARLTQISKQEIIRILRPRKGMSDGNP